MAKGKNKVSSGTVTVRNRPYGILLLLGIFMLALGAMAPDYWMWYLVVFAVALGLTLLVKNHEVLEKHPLVKSLLVPGESLAVARLKVKEPGTAHYANYHKLSQELIEEAQGKVRPEYEAHQRGAMDMPAGPMYARRWENKSTWVGAVVRLT